MTSQTEKATNFAELHRTRSPLLMPNAWDVGSARLLASLGLSAGHHEQWTCRHPRSA
jgi:2-methylisocitrate lyase-like PEP mutase family enzyme